MVNIFDSINSLGTDIINLATGTEVIQTKSGFNPNEIKSLITEGLARPSMYRIFIGGKNVPGLTRDMTLLCEAAELPGRQIITTEQTMYGLQRKMPYGVMYNELVLTFAEHADMRIRKFFDGWQRLISDPTNNYFNYYENYIADIEIYQLDELNFARYCVVLEEAYPVTISPQPLGYGEDNQYLKLPITFAYRRWRNLRDIALGSENHIKPKYTNGSNPDGPPDLSQPKWSQGDLAVDKENGDFTADRDVQRVTDYETSTPDRTVTIA